MSPPAVERRQHPRRPLAASVQFFHGPSRRDFPARCVDVSASGLKMYVPVASPVRAGQAVRLTLACVGAAEFSALGDRPVEATIVRVDRDELLKTGRLAVGVKFAVA